MFITTGIATKAKFEKKLAELNGKLAKYNLPAISLLSFKVREFLTTVSYGAFEYEAAFVVADVELSDVEVNHFGRTAQYIGSLKIENNVPMISASVENFPVIEARMVKPTCDHCKVNRNRSKYFFFIEGGKVVSIGSTCAKEYFGIDIEAYLTTMAKEIRDMEYQEESDPMKRDLSTDLNRVIIATAYATDNFKSAWIPASGDFATTGTVTNALYAGIEKPISSERVREVKAKLLEVYGAMKPETAFDWNIKHALFDDEGNLVGGGKLGIVAYAIWASFNQKIEASNKPSEFVGAVGEKITIEVTVKMNRAIETVYGISHLVIMEDSDGNVFKTFTTGAELSVADIGEKHKLVATVKSHEEYEGKKSTMITRAKEYVEKAAKGKKSKIA